MQRRGIREQAEEPAGQSYSCVDCGESVELGRARLGAVTCHDCSTAKNVRGVAAKPSADPTGLSRADLLAADSPFESQLDGAVMAELYRARRYQRPVVLASISRVSLNGHGQTATGDLRAHLRAIDHVWDRGDQIFILLPETDRAGADQLLERLVNAETGLLPNAVVNLASFPDDALTSTGLLAALSPTRNGNGSGAEA
jgi:hypothetical protein